MHLPSSAPTNLHLSIYHCSLSLPLLKGSTQGAVTKHLASPVKRFNFIFAQPPSQNTLCLICLLLWLDTYTPVRRLVMGSETGNTLASPCNKCQGDSSSWLQPWTHDYSLESLKVNLLFMLCKLGLRTFWQAHMKNCKNIAKLARLLDVVAVRFESHLG